MLALGATLGLAACASQPPAPLAARRGYAAAIQSTVVQVPGFALEGRLAIRRGERSDHVSIAWHREGDDDEVLITGPLGQGLARLFRDGRGARIELTDGRKFEGPDWETLAQRHFGLELPLNGLPDWLQGRADPVVWDGQGRPLRAQAEGWQIDYLEYAEGASALPQLVELTRGDLRLRLKIDQWTATENAPGPEAARPGTAATQP